MNRVDEMISEVETNLKNLNASSPVQEEIGKEWQSTIKVSQREYYRKILCEVLVDCGCSKDPKIAAHEIEKTFFDTAKERAEYYWMVAKEIYRICKAYEDNCM